MLKPTLLGFAIKDFVITLLSITLIVTIVAPILHNMAYNAQIYATTSVANALSSANASNYVTRQLNHALGASVSSCQDIENAMQAPVPSGYTISNDTVKLGSSTACTLNGPDGTSAKFTITGIS